VKKKKRSAYEAVLHPLAVAVGQGAAKVAGELRRVKVGAEVFDAVAEDDLERARADELGRDELLVVDRGRGELLRHLRDGLLEQAARADDVDRADEGGKLGLQSGK
jgi:hypothetical protein